MVTYEDLKKKFGYLEGKRLTRGRAIKVYCKELCSAGDYKSWSDCKQIYCPLWKFRKGNEIKGNLGSFGVRGNDTIQNKKQSLKQGITHSSRINKDTQGEVVKNKTTLNILNKLIEVSS